MYLTQHKERDSQVDSDECHPAVDDESKCSDDTEDSRHNAHETEDRFRLDPVRHHAGDDAEGGGEEGADAGAVPPGEHKEITKGKYAMIQRCIPGTLYLPDDCYNNMEMLQQSPQDQPQINTTDASPQSGVPPQSGMPEAPQYMVAPQANTQYMVAPQGAPPQYMNYQPPPTQYMAAPQSPPQQRQPPPTQHFSAVQSTQQTNLQSATNLPPGVRFPGQQQQPLQQFKVTEAVDKVGGCISSFFHNVVASGRKGYEAGAYPPPQGQQQPLPPQNTNQNANFTNSGGVNQARK